MCFMLYMSVQTGFLKNENTSHNIVIVSAYEWPEHVICDAFSLPGFKSGSAVSWLKRHVSEHRWRLSWTLGHLSLLQWNTLVSVFAAPNGERPGRKPQTDQTPAGFWDHSSQSKGFSLLFAFCSHLFFLIYDHVSKVGCEFLAVTLIITENILYF